VDVPVAEHEKAVLEVAQVEHPISFYVQRPRAATSNEERRRLWRQATGRRRTEEVDEEELRRLAVTGEWVLNKRGVYGSGGERRSELITGALHSPSLRVKKNKRNKKKKKKEKEKGETSV